ncbi:MAG TPA: dihydroorotase [Bacteroidia bacterium]|jgi:dihydroorotase|nr:dihydroorotase [Bacteroidia bacterium]
MGSKILIKNATLVNEGNTFSSDVLIVDDKIVSIAKEIPADENTNVIDALGLYLLPGVIDDQVHFREPGLTHKADIHSESRAAVAGGVTSFMDQPNTVPPAVTVELLEQKYKRASEVSLANYSFFMGTSNSNLDEIRKVDPTQVCGLKAFLGSSTGNLLVDNEKHLDDIFREVKMLIAVHSEDDPMIKANLEKYKAQFGENIPVEMHPLIRSREACVSMTKRTIARAKKFGTRLHIFHVSTADEVALFDNSIPLKEKNITAEACVHHLWFSDEDYKTKGNLIKWNPAVKTAKDREAIFQGVLDNRIDVIATDHAPHTLEEKKQNYLKAPSGGPLVQHSLVAMLEKVREKKITIERVVEKMSHAVAELFRIEKRGFIREGYFADLVLVDLNSPWIVSKENILSKCGWSPFEGQIFHARVTKTLVNGNVVYENGKVAEGKSGMRLTFSA